jgi:hypothetical protein
MVSMTDNTPILTSLGINIGGMFKYKDNFWVRTDRYSASCSRFGACRFGYIGEANSENDQEWQEVLDTAEILDMKKVERVLKEGFTNG